MTKNIKGICVVPKDFTVAPKSTKNNWWITATSGDNFANDFPKENHGLFTYYFLKALNGEKSVDANEGFIDCLGFFRQFDGPLYRFLRGFTPAKPYIH